MSLTHPTFPPLDQMMPGLILPLLRGLATSYRAVLGTSTLSISTSQAGRSVLAMVAKKVGVASIEDGVIVGTGVEISLATAPEAPREPDPILLNFIGSLTKNSSSETIILPVSLLIDLRQMSWSLPGKLKPSSYPCSWRSQELASNSTKYRWGRNYHS